MDSDFRVFRSEELWRPSIFTIGAEHQDSIFDGLRLDAEPPLPGIKEPKENLFDGVASDFSLPPLDDVSLEAELEKGATEKPCPEQAIGEPHQDQPMEAEESDVWNLDTNSASLKTGPQSHTWEAFQFKDEQQPNTHYLSEAGDHAFDAAIRQHEQSNGVITRGVMFRACCSLVLGRSSTFFQWNPIKKSFAPTLDKVALSGASLASSQSLVNAFTQIGAAFRELNAFVAKSSSQDSTAQVALKRSVNAVLDQFEQHICEQTTQIRSLLQLQQAIERPSFILRYLCHTVKKLARLETDEDVISTLSDEVTCLAESGHLLSGVMREILARVSMPWLQRLAEDVGLLPSLHAYEQDSHHDNEASGTEQSAEANFLGVEEIRHLSSVKRSIKLLRQHVPSHPLASSIGTLLGLDLLEATQSSGPDSIARLAAKYKDDMTDAVMKYHRGIQSERARPQFVVEEESISLSAENGDPFALTSFDEYDLQSQSAEIPPSIYDGLEKAITAALESTADCPAVEIDLIDGSILAPLRPFIKVQASLVNSAVMGYLFRTYNVRAHLELHRSYHLFGNGDFVTRLTTALFSDEVQSAERKRGNIPTSETMGLRLGSRESQRWPPASSELRLTLLDVLTDSYASHIDKENDNQLPGGLSFAIRELTDAEIDRVMDPTSIYALDFLRLQYTPPSPLVDIFSPTIVQHYDSIFRTLLMHVRVLHATSRLCSPKSAKPTTSLQRFAWKTRHFSTTLFSHFTDTVIASAWDDFSTNLTALEPTPPSLHPPSHEPTPTPNLPPR
ncbi:hypothetical protein Q7P37_011380 [Cladosporium fusiforme]